jgi:hypothetical protein
MRRPRTRNILIASGAALVLLAGGTAAFAAATGSPIDSNGAIHACYGKEASDGGFPVVLQDAGVSCPSKTTAIKWNQQGPQGPQGPQGAPGTGATVSSESPGSNCANGGAKITDGGGNTAYACTGDTGPQGPAGAAGPSTAGPSGLDTMTVSRSLNAFAGSVASLFVQCPADHPYVLGGGTHWNVLPNTGVPFTSNSNPETGILPQGWSAAGFNPSDDPAGTNAFFVFAICAK